jgi:feruloyl-CoA synthase
MPASAEKTRAAPLRPVRLGVPEPELERRTDGTILIRSRTPLPPFDARVTDALARWAEKAPDRLSLAHRDPDGAWRSMIYAEVRDAVARIAGALLRRGLSPERPIAILSGNDIEHALIGLAAMTIGVPYAPVSPAYSLLSSDFGKLRAILDVVTPGLVFANDGAMFARAIDAVVPESTEVVTARNAPANRKTTAIADLLGADDAAGVAAAHAAVTPDTIAKFLFTSGSTGHPKAVINTHRMLCSNQAMLYAGFRFVDEEPPVVLDWLPWSHTFGSNHNFNLVLTHGGSLYIDDGNPTPSGVPKTVRNLREIAPTIYFNVPKGYEALVPHLRADAELRRNFFSRLNVLFYAGAGLNQTTWDDLIDLAVSTTGERIILVSSLGSTETSPLALACTWDFPKAGNIGLPAPGVELKLVPNEGKLEARLRGPHITPGYWRAEHLTRAAFDDEGFYKIGDALKFVDPAAPEKGLLFDGRIAEDFKLSTGTWVSVGPLRARFLDHFAPFARDVVFAGPDRDEICALVFPDIEVCRKHAGLPAEATAADVLANPRVREKCTDLLRSLLAASSGTSTRILRLILMPEPASMDKGEMTDKGSINQRAVLANRAALVDELYAPEPSPRIIKAN